MKFLDTFNNDVDELVRIGRKNAPTILAAVGVCGFITAIVKTAQAAPKAVEAKKKLAKKITKDSTPIEKVVETVKAYGPVYAEPIILATGSTVCIVLSVKKSNSRLAAATTVASMWETKYKDYQEKTIEKFGKKKDQQIQDEIDQDNVKKNPCPKELIAEQVMGQVLCQDDVTKQYFMASIDDLKDLMRDLGDDLAAGYSEFIAFNEWVNLVDNKDFNPVDFGWDIGWNPGNRPKLYTTVVETSNGRACYVIKYTEPPKYDKYETYK